MADRAKLDLLWKHVEDARLRWKLARNYVNEVNENRASGAMPYSDGSYAHLHALHAQRLAVESYRRALQDFQAALTLDKAPSTISQEETALEMPGGGEDRWSYRHHPKRTPGAGTHRFRKVQQGNRSPSWHSV